MTDDGDEDDDDDDADVVPVDPTVPGGWIPEAYATAYDGMVRAAGKLATPEGQAWKVKAVATIEAVAIAWPEFIADDVWTAMPCEPWEKRHYGSSLGPLMKAMAKAGWMTATAHMRSGRGPTHGHTVVVWRSNVYRCERGRVWPGKGQTRP